MGAEHGAPVRAGFDPANVSLNHGAFLPA